MGTSVTGVGASRVTKRRARNECGTGGTAATGAGGEAGTDAAGDAGNGTGGSSGSETGGSSGSGTGGGGTNGREHRVGHRALLARLRRHLLAQLWCCGPTWVGTAAAGHAVFVSADAPHKVVFDTY